MESVHIPVRAINIHIYLVENDRNRLLNRWCELTLKHCLLNMIQLGTVHT